MPDFSYAYRPAKHIVRRMIVDACRRLWPFGPLSDYSYVGFGGLEYHDFDLFRRHLGIEMMISIEQDSYRRDRYVFNAPYSGIRVVSERASAALPRLPLEGRQIIWLDYTETLSDEFIDDATHCIGRIWASSVLIITLNARPPIRIADRVTDLKERIGSQRVPLGLSAEDLGEWGLAAVQKQVLTEALMQACASRGDGARLQQIFDFQYADDARMQTLGFVLLGPSDERLFEDLRLSDLEFVRLGGEPITIVVPTLTPREILYLGQQLPLDAAAALSAPGIPEEDASAFEAFYRWYPPVRSI